jgi:hypothetical protein
MDMISFCNIKPGRNKFYIVILKLVKLFIMKKLALVILPLILFSCTNKSNNSVNEVIPESFQEITYLRDTLVNEMIPNGFFENEDEGTGAGVFTSQLCGWRTSDGKDILGINGFFRDPGSSFPINSGDPPTFYLFENKSFTKLTNIFPEVKANLFFDSDTVSVEGIPTYFNLPREGETIQYNLGVPIDFLRKNYNDYKEICDMYSNIKRTSIDMAFDRIIGTFHVSN